MHIKLQYKFAFGMLTDLGGRELQEFEENLILRPLIAALYMYHLYLLTILIEVKSVTLLSPS